MLRLRRIRIQAHLRPEVINSGVICCFFVFVGQRPSNIGSAQVTAVVQPTQFELSINMTHLG